MQKLEKIKEKCTKDTSKKFVADMIEAGLEDNITWYMGRSFWEGPAVTVDHLQDALSATKVRCNYDNLGKGYIVHPVTPEKRSYL